MSTPEYHLLSWDSDFLGCEVARIAPQIEDEKSVTRALRDLKAAGVRLVYWQPHDSEALRKFARAAGASFVGTRVRFERDTAIPQTIARSGLGLQLCSGTTRELEELAVAAGALSRFALDPAMPAGTAVRLYTLWMRESFGGAMGDEVLAARDAAGVAGMVTLKRDAGTGVIGLVSVAERCRGTGVGRFLLEAASARFAEFGMARASVVTQGENHAACRLYRACGYAAIETSITAHFWFT
jgi:ribosomal protein S18 acetylase RimI-like enzyme